VPPLVVIAFLTLSWPLSWPLGGEGDSWFEWTAALVGMAVRHRNHLPTAPGICLPTSLPLAAPVAAPDRERRHPRSALEIDYDVVVAALTAVEGTLVASVDAPKAAESAENVAALKPHRVVEDLVAHRAYELTRGGGIEHHRSCLRLFGNVNTIPHHHLPRSVVSSLLEHRATVEQPVVAVVVPLGALLAGTDDVVSKLILR